jgi:hypothetical protein
LPGSAATSSLQPALLALAPPPAPAATVRFRLSPAAKPVLVLLCIGLALSPFAHNTGLIALACATLVAIVLLVWPGDLPPSLLVICGMQWLQGSLNIFVAELDGVELWSTSRATPSLESASQLTMLWAAVLAIGMRLSLRGMKAAVRPNDVDVGTALGVYLAWCGTMPILALITPDAGRQILVALSALRWAAVYALFDTILRRRRGYSLMVIVLAIEVGLGFLSFFSNFKAALIVLLIALLARTQRLSMRQVLGIVATAVLTIYLGILWSAIKGEYRRVLNQGAQDQVVRVHASEQVEALQHVIGNIDQSRFDLATEGFVDRIAYVTYFAHTMDFVPRVRPHEDGRIWMAAVEHVLLPRLLFWDKAPLESDTVVAERYTGLELGAHRGTSISIGLPAESYVDFGFPMMLIPALILGLIHGFAYRILLGRRAHAPYGEGFAAAFSIPFMVVELSAANTLGAFLTLSIVATGIWLLAMPSVLKLGSRLVQFNLGPDRRGTMPSTNVPRS